MPKRRTDERVRVAPPVMDLAAVRQAVGITLEELSARVGLITGKRPSIGGLSAIENGHRGASAELLAAIAEAYGVEPSQISVEYRPRQWTPVNARTAS